MTMGDLVTMDSSQLAALERYGNEVGSGAVQYLKFDHKSGAFTFGQEEEVIEEEESFAADISSLKQGAIAWDDGSVAGEVMEPVLSGRTVDINKLDDVGAEWKEQSSIEFTSLETGDKMLFKTSSLGGTRSIGSLTKEIIARVKRGHVDNIPVVTMEYGSYKHKKFGKQYTPKFVVQEWLSPAGASHAAAGEAEEVAEVEVIEAETPKKATRSKRRSVSGDAVAV